MITYFIILSFLLLGCECVRECIKHDYEYLDAACKIEKPLPDQGCPPESWFFKSLTGLHIPTFLE
ncbi:unnamed protein product [Amoebophrya sp. A25]|nr:unnamed protein product [Amoebophrya sp. A25]|eukprot:GSA25T00023528001.1